MNLYGENFKTKDFLLITLGKIIKPKGKYSNLLKRQMKIIMWKIPLRKLLIHTILPIFFKRYYKIWKISRYHINPWPASSINTIKKTKKYSLTVCKLPVPNSHSMRPYQIADDLLTENSARLMSCLGTH